MKICTISRCGTVMANCGNGIFRGVYIGAVYEAYLTKNNEYVWKRVSCDDFGRSNTGISDKYIKEIKQQSKYPFYLGIRQYHKVLK